MLKSRRLQRVQDDYFSPETKRPSAHFADSTSTSWMGRDACLADRELKSRRSYWVVPLPRNSYTLLRVCAHEHAGVAQRHACWDRGHHFAQEVSWSAVFILFLWRSVSIY